MFTQSLRVGILSAFVAWQFVGALSQNAFAKTFEEYVREVEQIKDQKERDHDLLGIANTYIDRKELQRARQIALKISDPCYKSDVWRDIFSVSKLKSDVDKAYAETKNIKQPREHLSALRKIADVFIELERQKNYKAQSFNEKDYFTANRACSAGNFDIARKKAKSLASHEKRVQVFLVIVQNTKARDDVKYLQREIKKYKDPGYRFQLLFGIAKTTKNKEDISEAISELKAIKNPIEKSVDLYNLAVLLAEEKDLKTAEDIAKRIDDSILQTMALNAIESNSDGEK